MKKKIFVIFATLTVVVFLYGCTAEKENSETITSTQTAAVEMTAAAEVFETETTVEVQVHEERDIPVETTSLSTDESEEVTSPRIEPNASEQPSVATEAATEPQPSFTPTETAPANQPHSDETERG